MARNGARSGGAARHLILALLLTVLGLMAPAPSLAADGTTPTIGGFSARALGPGDQVTPDTYFTETVEPGDTFEGRILVQSSSPQGARVRIYSVDGLTGPTSGAVYANLDDPRTGVSRWTKPKKALIQLGAKQQKKVGFTVTVPQDATPGDHVGAIALQLADQETKKGQFAVTEVIRVAVAIHITVRGPAKAMLKPTDLELEALTGTQIPSVTVGLDNTGQLLCRPKLSVSLAQDGTTLGTVDRQLDTILPGTSIPFQLAWPKPLKPGTYEATALTQGCGDPQTVEASLELTSALRGSTQTPGPNILPEETGSGGVPWWALVIAVLVALGGGWFLARRGPRRKDDGDTGGAAAA